MPFFRDADPGPIQVNGRELRCQVCGAGEFRRREALLNTALATALNFDWANRSAVCYVCATCGYIHWFLPQQ